ncbi:MAG: hypothetical protein JNL70_25710 [Saprospiraceae bacterium]|nr:hypothetical protein [Saprospiraceae bacterium]
MHKLILTFLLATGLCFATWGQTNCIPSTTKSNICAGIDVGARGIKPVVIQINPSTANNKLVELRRISKDLKADNSFDLLRDTSSTMLDCAARHIAKFVDVFQGPLYNVASDRIFVVLSSGLVGGMRGQEKRLALFKQKIKEYSGVDVRELTEKDEGELTVRSVTSDDDLKKAKIHVLDIGSGSIKGGYQEDDDYINQFSAIVGVRLLGVKLDSIATAQSLSYDNPDHRYILAKAARAYFKSNFLDAGKPLDVTKNVTDGVCWAGGIVYVFTTWFKPEDIANGRKYITFRFDDIDYFFQKVISSKNTDELFKNSPQLEEGMTRASKEFFYDAKKVISRDAEMIAGAAILKELGDKYRAMGVKENVFNAELLFGWIKYYMYWRVR